MITQEKMKAALVHRSLKGELDAVLVKADHLQLQLHNKNKDRAQEKMKADLVHQQLKG